MVYKCIQGKSEPIILQQAIGVKQYILAMACECLKLAVQ